jgi:hypothetical protein
MVEGRALSDRLIVETPWMEEATAFTASGPYIHFTAIFRFGIAGRCCGSNLEARKGGGKERKVQPEGVAASLPPPPPCPLPD